MEKEIWISSPQEVSGSPTEPSLPASLYKATYSSLTAHVYLTLDEDEDAKGFYLCPMKKLYNEMNATSGIAFILVLALPQTASWP